MKSIGEGLYEIGRLEQFALGDSAVHRIDARVKVLVTLAFIICVVSFTRYTVAQMLPFALFPLAVAVDSRIPLDWLASRLLAVAPFALLVGMFNPLLDREVMIAAGAFQVAAGWISYLSIIARFLLTTAAALVLVATTSFNGVCRALEQLGVPSVFATQLLFLYRYIFVLGEEALRMQRARDLRSFGRGGTGIRVFGNLVGHLLLRTYSRADRVYSAMLLRGFDGHIRTRTGPRLRLADGVFFVGWLTLFLTLRLVNVPLLMGAFVTRVLS